jgi:sterol desaturase/sphingolipid hydroxylase (fatty acid hydroxylase superfamily)
MSGYDAIILITFMGLVSATLANWHRTQHRTQQWHKSGQDWLLDSCGLAVQGVIIPLLQGGLYGVLHQTLPHFESVIDLPNIATFLISFVLVDYLYYWNHRWLHRWAWRWHQVHHTITEMDVLGTSRNTLWTSGLIIYLWIHPLFLYLLDHPAGYLLGVSLTAALDLWRHSRFDPPPAWRRWLSPWLVLPQDHAWHHASSQNQAVNCSVNSCSVNSCSVNSCSVNYSANWKWDRWHGTSYDADTPPITLGITLKASLWQKLFLPGSHSH